MTGILKMPDERETTISEDDLARRLEDLEARERTLETKERAAKARGLKHNLYERIDVSVKTMDRVILICAAVILALVLIGVIDGRSN